MMEGSGFTIEGIDDFKPLETTGPVLDVFIKQQIAAEHSYGDTPPKACID